MKHSTTSGQKLCVFWHRRLNGLSRVYITVSIKRWMVSTQYSPHKPSGANWVLQWRMDKLQCDQIIPQVCSYQYPSVILCKCVCVCVCVFSVWERKSSNPAPISKDCMHQQLSGSSQDVCVCLCVCASGCEKNTKRFKSNTKTHSGVLICR